MSTKYRIGHLVWAELRGYCPWPARVSVPPPHLEPPDEQISNKQHCIYFFGSKKYEWIQESDIKPYEKYQEEMMRYCTINGFMDALNEIVDYMEDPEKFPELVDVEIKEEVDDAMECDDNGYEAMDTSAVEQERDKIDESAIPTLQVTLLRVPIYECEDCAVCFLKRREFEHHKLTHIEEMDDEENSTETRKDHDNLNNNLKISDVAESEKQTITCNIFDNVIKLKVKKNGRVKVPSTLDPIVPLDRIDSRKCELCAEHFVDPNEYRVHKMSHLERFEVTKDNDVVGKIYKCPKCDVRFVLKSTLDTHLLVHDRFICHCGIGYSRFTEFKEHKKLKHGEVVCNSEDTSEVELVTAQGSDRKEFQLKIKSRAKNKMSKGKSSPGTVMKQHNVIKTKLGFFSRLKVIKGRLKAKKKVRTEQNTRNDKPKQTFSCSFCEKIFNDNRNLKVHLAVHTKERPYPCNLCENRFTRLGALHAHLRRHTGIKNFVCRYCPKAFYETDKRTVHERTHTGTNSYHCIYCDEEFSDSSACKSHIRTHAGEKRYQCDVCCKPFRVAGFLERHKIKEHDKSKTFNCKICFQSFCYAYELQKHVEITH